MDRVVYGGVDRLVFCMFETACFFDLMYSSELSQHLFVYTSVQSVPVHHLKTPSSAFTARRLPQVLGARRHATCSAPPNPP